MVNLVLDTKFGHYLLSVKEKSVKQKLLVPKSGK